MQKNNENLIVGILSIVGLGLAVNAAWMVVAPLSWYRNAPAGVPDFGPFNVHFIRDLGGAFLVLALALFWAARSRQLRLPLTALATLFFVLHAIVHVHATLAGHVSADHWWIDFPLTYLPVLLLVPVCVHLRRVAG